jgi:hypothetical protein
MIDIAYTSDACMVHVPLRTILLPLASQYCTICTICTMHTCMQTCRTAKSFSFVSVIVFDLGAGISTAGKLITDGHVLNCSQA